jgi:hypothetical protein
MRYDNTTAIMSAGMQCLRERLGVLDSEIFVATIKAEDFNYTDWRQNQPWLDTPISEILDNAETFAKNNPGMIPPNATIL